MFHLLNLNAMKSQHFLLVVMMFLLCHTPFAQSPYGAIQLTVTEQENGMPIPFANVALVQDDSLISDASTDFDGVCIFRAVPVGIYDVEVMSLGFTALRIIDVEVVGNEISEIADSVTVMTLVAMHMDNIDIRSSCTRRIKESRKHNINEIGRIPPRKLNLTATMVSCGCVNNEDRDRAFSSDIKYYHVDGISITPVLASTKPTFEELTGGLSARYGTSQSIDLHSMHNASSLNSSTAPNF